MQPWVPSKFPSGWMPKPLRFTVDVKNATYTNSIGDPFLAAYWKDSDFDPKQRAFYYVRVIEIPTPTWIAFDEKNY
jgi:hypothetical protein